MADKKSTGGIVAAVLGIIWTCLKLWRDHKKEQAAASTPERKAEDDKKKFENAVASGDVTVINDMLSGVYKNRHPPGNNAGIPGNNKMPL